MGFPPPSLSLHLSTEGSSLGLWCSSCLVQVFSASSLQSLPHAPRGLFGRIIHILSTLPHTILFQMAGPACLFERLSAKCERMCVLNGISLCMALPSCSTLNERPPSFTYIRRMFCSLYTAPYLHSDYTVYRCVRVCVHVCMVECACLWWKLSTRIQS